MSFLIRFFPRFGNLVIKISGRINGNLRTRSRIFSFGKMLNFQLLTRKIAYSYHQAITPTGVLGIQI
jgi:ribosomal protein S3